MDALQVTLNREVYGNSLGQWLEAAAVFVLLSAALPVVRALIDRRLNSLKPDQSPTALALVLVLAMLRQTMRLFMVAVALYVALGSLNVPAKIQRLLDVGIAIAVWLQAALWGAVAVRFVIDRRISHVGGERVATLGVLRFVAVMVVWALASLMLLSNLGVNITALVASLGVGGVAVALAVQNVLGDVFASLAIALDKPFQLGDRLQIDNVEGRVEHIGIKSTHLRSIDGEQIIIANAQLLAAKLRNFGRAMELRAQYVLSVAYDTPTDILRQLPGLVEEVVRDLRGVRFERCYFRGFGGAGLEFEITFYVLEPASTPMPEVRQQFNLALIERLQAANIRFDAASHVLALQPRPQQEQAA
jgi:small-conductance mechanosensitive channel